jgi:hypothetical protein
MITAITGASPPIWTAVERGFSAVVAEHIGLICGGHADAVGGGGRAVHGLGAGLRQPVVVLPVNRFRTFWGISSAILAIMPVGAADV